MDFRTITLLLWLTVIISQFARAEDITLEFTQSQDTGITAEALEKTLNEVIKSAQPLKISNNPAAEILSLNALDASADCESNQLRLLPKTLASYDLTSSKRYFFNKSDNCTISYAVYSYVIASIRSNLLPNAPSSPADLFDLQRFPGPRALPDSPIGILEWALLAYHIPINEVYELLSTDRGLDLAFRKLDEIKHQILWWKTTDELKSLISSKKVFLVAGPHTVFYDLQFIEPLHIVWDGQLMIDMKLAIQKSTLNTKSAEQVVKEFLSDSVQFKLAHQFALSPVRLDTLNDLEKLPQLGQILSYLPTYHKNQKKALWLDHRWHHALKEKINRRFQQWRYDNL